MRQGPSLQVPLVCRGRADDPDATSLRNGPDSHNGVVRQAGPATDRATRDGCCGGRCRFQGRHRPAPNRITPASVITPASQQLTVASRTTLPTAENGRSSRSESKNITSLLLGEAGSYLR